MDCRRHFQDHPWTLSYLVQFITWLSIHRLSLHNDHKSNKRDVVRWHIIFPTSSNQLITMSHCTTLILNISHSPEMSPSSWSSWTLTDSVSLEELDALEDTIVLNSHELEIREATIQATQTKTESTVTAKTISYDEKGRTATLDFGQKIRHDNRKSILSMKFDGILNNAMAGFYRSAYTDTNGEKRFMFSTQCEVVPYWVLNWV